MRTQNLTQVQAKNLPRKEMSGSEPALAQQTFNHSFI